jgi:hypothetical protein
MALGLPASRQQPGKFGFISEYDYVGVSQRRPAPWNIPPVSPGTQREQLQFFCFIQRREQTFRADPEIYRRFRVFR